jgi:hypothetical protein
MAHDDQRRWRSQQGVAFEITCVSVDRFDEITHLGGPSEDGSIWRLTPTALIEAIRGGTRYYIRIEGNSFLVSVGKDDNDKPVLSVGVKEVYLLNLLPRFAA